MNHHDSSMLLFIFFRNSFSAICTIGGSWGVHQSPQRGTGLILSPYTAGNFQKKKVVKRIVLNVKLKWLHFYFSPAVHRGRGGGGHGDECQRTVVFIHYSYPVWWSKVYLIWIDERRETPRESMHNLAENASSPNTPSPNPTPTQDLIFYWTTWITQMSLCIFICNIQRDQSLSFNY